MTIRIIFFFLFSCFFMGYGQIEWDKTSFNYGVISKSTNRIVDFKVTNKSNKSIYLMRANVPKDVSIYYKRTKIMPDSSAFVRVQINPTTMGSLNRKVELYISSETKPVKLVLKGVVNYFDPVATYDCPDFSLVKPTPQRTENMVVEVIDAVTKKKIVNANVNIITPVILCLCSRD